MSLKDKINSLDAKSIDLSYGISIIEDAIEKLECLGISSEYADDYPEVKELIKNMQKCADKLSSDRISITDEINTIQDNCEHKYKFLYTFVGVKIYECELCGQIKRESLDKSLLKDN